MTAPAKHVEQAGPADAGTGPVGSGGPVGPVGKALTLLRALADRGGEGSLADLSRSSGLPKSTAHRLLNVLEAQGAVVRTRCGYCLGDLALRLGGGMDADLRARLVRPVKPYLVELFETAGHSVSLGVLRGSRVAYLDTVFGHSAPPGDHWSSWAPVHSTAVGKVLLAFDPAALDRFLTGREALEPLTRHTMTSPDRFLRALADVRRLGIAEMRHEYAVGVVGLAVPLTVPPGGTAAAIGVTGPEDRFDWGQVATALRTAAHGASVAVRSRRACRAAPRGGVRGGAPGAGRRGRRAPRAGG